MKLKKILSILVSVVLVLSSIVPVFASVEVATENAVTPTSAGSGTLVKNEDGTFTHTADAAASNDFYARTAFGPGLNGNSVGMLSFDVVPSIDVQTRIKYYYPKTTDGQQKGGSMDINLGKVLVTGAVNKVNVVYDKYNPTTDTQKSLIFINGSLVGKDTTTTGKGLDENGSQVVVKSWELFQFGPRGLAGGESNPYNYTYSNIKSIQYTAETEIEDVLAEYGLNENSYIITEFANYNSASATTSNFGTVHTAGTAPNGGLYIRSFMQSPIVLKSTSYSAISFEVLPTVAEQVYISLYDPQLNSKLVDADGNAVPDKNGNDQYGTTPNRPEADISKSLKAGEKNKIDVVFGTYDAVKHSQPVLVFVNGVYAETLYDVKTDANTKIAQNDGSTVYRHIENWGGIVFGSKKAPGSTPYSFTYSNAKGVQYSAGTTLTSIINEIGKNASFGDVIWSGVPVISGNACTMDSSDAANGNFVFSDVTSATNRPGAYIKTGENYAFSEYSPERYVVTEMTVELPNDSHSNFLRIDGSPMNSVVSTNFKGMSIKVTVINDTKDKKHYIYFDNVPSSNNGTSYETYDGQIRLVVQTDSTAKSGIFFKVKALKTTAYKDGVYDPLKPLSGATVTNSVGNLTSIKNSLNVGMEETDEAGTYTWSMPAGTDTAALSQSAIWTLSGHFDYGKDYPVDLSYMHTSMEIIPSKFDGGNVTFGFSHNGGEFASNTVPVQLKNIGETYKFDFFWDYKTLELKGFVNGVKVIDSKASVTSHKRVFGTRFVFSGFGTENTESPVELTVKNVQTTKYWDNEPVYTSFDALISDKVSAKEVGYNFVTDATLTEDGKYTFKKEVFGYNSNFQSGLVAAYDANDALIATKIFNTYNGDEVMTLTKAPAYFKLFLWGKDNKNPLIEAKTVNIAQ